MIRVAYYAGMLTTPNKSRAEILRRPKTIDFNFNFFNFGFSLMKMKKIHYKQTY